MNKAELIAAVAAKTGDTKKAAEEAVNAFVEVVTNALETHKLKKKSKYLHQKLQYSKLVKH